MVDPLKAHNCTNESDQYVDVLGKTVQCTAGDIMTKEKQEILEYSIIPEAVKLHADRLAVEPLTYPIVAPKYRDTSVCGRLNIPKEHHTTGVDGADMVLYATAAPTVDGAFAWAATCAVHPNGRPLIGVINYSPRHIARTSHAVRVAAHEIAHTLGFNVETMHKRAKLVGISTYEARGKEVYIFDAAKTKQWGAYHYQCKGFHGMEMEDSMTWAADEQSAKVSQSTSLGLKSAVALGIQAQKGTTGRQMSKKRQSDRTEWDLSTKMGVSSHWKRLLAKDELMAGLVGVGRYTAITLAAFSDLQFYSVDMSKAEPMSWGNYSGCDFLKSKSCVTNGKSNYPSMFCDKHDDALLRCTSDRQALGKCVTGKYDDLPAIYSYFKTPTDDGKVLGGRREDMMDYCPIIVADKGFSCTDGNESNMPGSLIRENSRCVEGKDLKVGDTPIGDVCVQMKCARGGVYFRIAGNNTWYGCPEGGSRNVTKIKGALTGTIVCPNVSDVCPTKLPSLRRRSGASGRHVPSTVLQMLANIFQGRRRTGSGLEENKPVTGGSTPDSVDTRDAAVANANEAQTVHETGVISSTGALQTGGDTSSIHQASDAASSVDPSPSNEEHGSLRTEGTTDGSISHGNEGNSADNTGSQASVNIRRASIVKTHGKNLDLKLNADGSAAASALAPLVLAVVAASAIMAH
ncbi:putative surface protease GP63, putative,metallopeptidase [Trypanosoma grayi]|uniref:putative surface protease GP63, putative,metallopeptidase n=1 Tax=Trypanosoma grayi TaxID=71804 RepID=UPI0004F475CD|nr:putative surface protease GP63, putative,metallopeptidase [Trypanosoma grayi]KEG05971.1 putative surface protease GP63, putative,metallopeptidase [Trypanosoma grayi]